MNSEKKKKTIYYKKAEFNPNGANLQILLEKALIKANKIQDRIETVDVHGTVIRLINSSKKQGGIFFGQFIMFEPGKDQNVIVIDEDTQEYPVEFWQLPKKEDGKKRELLESVLYFAIFENHVVLVQSRSLRSRDFEIHLMWLLREKLHLVNDSTLICLSDHISKKAKEKIAKLPVKKVSLGAPLMSTGVTLDVSESGGSKEKQVFKPYGQGFEILEKVLGQDWRKGLKLEDSLDDANLQVNIEVTYSRKTTAKAHKLLNSIAQSMRHADPDDVTIHLKGGGKIQGAELKFSDHINVVTYNGIPDSNDLYIELETWIRNKITEGAII